VGKGGGSIADIAHLLRRAGFGATPDEIAALAEAGLNQTIEQLVDYEQIPDNFGPPAPDTIALGRARNITELTVWWLTRMISTSRPLQEKMTLFWHGHFATAIQKVLEPAFMYQQDALFRDNALGRFDVLLSGVYKDPAMLIWLDGRRNVKQAPNENFAREVMELFTLGHGNYTEDDVHAGARAFTGWQLDVTTGAVTFNPRLHDDSIKTYLGHTGNFDGEAAVAILAAHPATGPFLAQKLWSFFASDSAPSSALKAMAEVYYASSHSIREMVRTMFSRPEFYADAVKTGHIKSPTEFAVSAIRQMGLAPANLSTVPPQLTLLGQELFNPPNVGGWAGGPSWINATTMLGRFNFASELTGDLGNTTVSTFDPAILLQASRARSMKQLASYIAGMLGVNPGTPTAQALAAYAGAGSVERPDILTKVRGLVHLTLASPEFQVS
jgi:uncharacterized protein (DUF1800 family)